MELTQKAKDALRFEIISKRRLIRRVIRALPKTTENSQEIARLMVEHANLGARLERLE